MIWVMIDDNICHEIEVKIMKIKVLCCGIDHCENCNLNF